MYGTHLQKVDEKGRLILPARARGELADGLFLTKGQDRCIFVFSRDQFENFKQEMRDSRMEGIDPRAFDRIMFASIHEDMPDKQGRITIPAALRGYASLEREVAVIGMEKRMEIWDAAAWEAYQEQFQAVYAALGGDVRLAN